MDITEVFVVEKRMIELTYPIDSKNIVVKTCLKPLRKVNILQNQTNGHLQLLTVRGLN